MKKLLHILLAALALAAAPARAQLVPIVDDDGQLVWPTTLIVPSGGGITLGGVFRTNWPTASASVVTNLADVQDVSFASLAAWDLFYWDGTNRWRNMATTSAGRSLLQAADAAAQRTALGLGTAATSASTAFEPAGVAAADITDSTSAGRSLLTAADAAAQRTALGLGTAATNAAGAFQAADADLDDLADGSLTGSKVGTGINGDNVTSGTVADARIASTLARDSEVAAGYQPLDADLTDLADGSLTGSKVGTGIDAANVTTGTLPEARIPATIARTNAPTLHNATLLGTTTLETLDVTGALTAGAVAGSASGLTNINAGNISSGTLSTARYTRTGVPREIWIPASAMNPGTSDPPTAATNVWGTTTDAQPIEAWDFSASSTNSVFFLLTLPQQWNGSTVRAKVFWKQVTAEANTTNVWVIGGGSLNDGEAGGNTLGTLVTVLDQGKNDTNQLAISDASSAITIGGTPSAGHLTWFTVKRHPGNTSDNATVLGRLIGVLLQYVETATEASAW